jgi:predicted phage-related endonuclease
VKIHTIDQRSPEWFALRAGRLTGSAAADMLATIKGKGEAAARRDLRLRLVCERLTGIPQEDAYINAAMQRGIDKEADAIAAYEAETGNLVRRTGFIQHDDLMAGCSLDGDVDDFTGIIEVKCPKSSTHLSTARALDVPSGYIPQISHNLWITGAKWCDFISFDDRLPPELALVIVRVTLDTTAYEMAARAFLTEVDGELKAVDAMRAERRKAQAA